MGISTTETYDAGEVGARHHDEQANGAVDQGPDSRSTPALLTPEERSRLLTRLDTYNEQLAEASMQLDYGSLDRSADLAALYEDRTWVAELEPPKTHDKRGRPLNNPARPDCRNRFVLWLREHRGWKLVGSRGYQL